MKVRVRIGELALDGLPATAGEEIRAAIAAALPAALRTASALPLARRVEVLRATVGGSQTGARPFAEQVGQTIARTVGGDGGGER